MSDRFKTLQALEDTTTSTLALVRDGHLKCDFLLRRFKTRDPAEMEGMRALFAQLSIIESPRIDRIVEAGIDNESFFVLTPAPLEGVTLPLILQRGPLSTEEFEIIATQLLDALEVVHDQAIVHGTLTPECVRIIGVKPEDWQVKLGGFGIGFAAAGTEVEHQIAAYRCAAPEQWQKTAARRRTDIYSLGCVLYEALAGRPPFQSRTLKELRAKHVGHDLPDLSKLATHVPRWICQWVMSLIVADPEARPRKASVARETFLLRDKVDAPAIVAVAVPVMPPVSAAQPGISAPVMLPVTQPARQATASTIPIAVGPKVGAHPPPRRPAPVPTVPKKPSPREFSNQPTPRAAWKRPHLIMGAITVVLILIWLLNR